MKSMSQLYGLGVTALSVLVAALVSWARLKPYVDAGEKYTPLSFAVYPALTAAAIVIPVVFLLRKWQGKKVLEIGPIAFPGEFAFVAFGCWMYVIVAVVFFPYQPPIRPTPDNPYRPAVREVAIPAGSHSV
jgi:hypothetical protein